MQLVRLGAEDERPAFDCGDDDLNEYFEKDSRQSCQELTAVTYAVMQGDDTVAFFSVLNDSLKKEEVGRTSYKRATRPLPAAKQYSSLPAVKIGRLAVASKHQRLGIGCEIIDFIKAWFTMGNKTGCRFVTVDAYRNAIRFYEKNGFVFLGGKDKDEKTRIMYFDLITVARTLREEEAA